MTTSVPSESTSILSTRQRLLEVACELFARKGLRSTTVAEICSEAQANIAAVNYHFGSKEDLYFAAWRHAFLYAQQIYPIHGNLPADAPPKERLRATIYSLLHRVMDTGKLGYAGQLLLREMGQQSLISHEIRHQVIEPIRKHVTGLIMEIVGDDVPRLQARMCTFSFISQCLSIGFKGGRLPLEFADQPVTDELVELFTDHILEFTLGGITAIRQQIHSAKGNNPTP
jgi:AcrR family transcriptional regulator